MKTGTLRQAQGKLFRLKSGLAQMLKGGVIMDVVNAEQARILEALKAVRHMRTIRREITALKKGGW